MLRWLTLRILDTTFPFPKASWMVVITLTIVLGLQGKVDEQKYLVGMNELPRTMLLNHVIDSHKTRPHAPRITSGSAEHTPELNHSRARLICSGILRNPESGWNLEGRTRDLSHNTMVPYYHMVLFCNLPHRSMMPVVPGPPPSPSSLPTAGIRHPRHPEPVDAETER